jgi:tetratricopeptide (TPR) repeat protein
LLTYQRRFAPARELFERAVLVLEDLSRREPGNREYKVELVQFYNNIAYALREQGSFELAKQRNSQALDLIEELARPAPSLGIEWADGHNLRGRILETQNLPGAVHEYGRSLDLYRRAARDGQSWHLPKFHRRYGDLLINLAALCRENPDAEDARELLTQALSSYWRIAHNIAESGSATEAQSVLDNLSSLMPLLDEPDRSSLTGLYPELHQKLRDRASGRQ